ncbi:MULTISPECIES: DNA polymerase III subunit gamma/tau [unclassified Arsukibacterium]|uniref:DNA polymerase III subunit gamma/tau n=1 Tax=unclassified Arsukibacterium TaxID=2635278 RepID=UPI000C8CA0F8|nr:MULTISPECIES: DNA polymerase III subunit gamma/tau [unclassified Arsukibacterium]MAA95635.1 DNA polymerase III subunit gamma/tau [Rheinheimera sp.]HAW91520.1 DNA polymerase III subunit gamma/tau [Candidatus Azambacteria bacterium]|tara:strand:+ start:132138 stop:134246 length:2109 start_codon:yes stop_codon:yes gene_type:complete
MSYQVLARKWRPKQFSELVGQSHVKVALSNALTSSRLHHAYLFTGTRGVGKTTIARIFAKSLNCETGITATPCGVCSACQEIDAGNFVDLLEIDAASRTKVEDTRDLLDNVQYAPSRGRFKVYLIDEVHMLSRHSFNALLKTLEEPPPHVKFLLATTDPQKLPVTVLSRCLQFSLKALSPDQIAGHLAYVLQQEQIPFETAALTLLAKAANGSLRDSLSLTDQAIAQSNSQLSLDTVREMLGFLDQQFASAMLSAILRQDFQALQAELNALISQHNSYSSVLDDMLSLLHQGALTQLEPTAAQLSEQPEFVTELAASQSPEALQIYYQLLISGKRELRYAPDERTGLEMALLRALAFVPAPAGAAGVTPTPAGRTADAQSPQTSGSAAYAVQPAAVEGEAAKTTDSQLPAQPEAMPNVAPSQPVPTVDSGAAEPVANVQAMKAAPAASIDPLTASIIKRRGLTSDVGDLSPKKPEHRPAPVPAPAPDVINEQPGAAVTKSAGQMQPVRRPDSAPAADHHAMAEYPDEAEPEPEQLYPEDPANQAMLDSLWQQSHQQAEPAKAFDGEINEQNFSVRFAAEVDSWAALIEKMPVGGLMRLFLLNSAMQLDQQQLTLQVQQSQQHLDNEAFRNQLQNLLSDAMGQSLQLAINYSNNVEQCPLAIQQRIEQERLSYVSRLMQHDPNVHQLQQQFDASLLLDTLQVN